MALFSPVVIEQSFQNCSIKLIDGTPQFPIGINLLLVAIESVSQVGISRPVCELTQLDLYSAYSIDCPYALFTLYHFKKKKIAR